MKKTMYQALNICFAIYQMKRTLNKFGSLLFKNIMQLIFWLTTQLLRED